MQEEHQPPHQQSWPDVLVVQIWPRKLALAYQTTKGMGPGHERLWGKRPTRGPEPVTLTVVSKLASQLVVASVDRGRSGHFEVKVSQAWV